MILVDSSVWIDYLSLQTSRTGQTLESLIRPTLRAAIAGIILQEILQGIKNEETRALTDRLLRNMIFLSPQRETHFLAAEIFRKMMRKGKAVSSIDALISALAVECKIPLFTLDQDFEGIAAYSDLKLFETAPRK